VAIKSKSQKSEISGMRMRKKWSNKLSTQRAAAKLQEADILQAKARIHQGVILRSKDEKR